MEADPASGKLCVFKLIDEGKWPRKFISLTVLLFEHCKAITKTKQMITSYCFKLSWRISPCLFSFACNMGWCVSSGEKLYVSCFIRARGQSKQGHTHCVLMAYYCSCEKCWCRVVIGYHAGYTNNISVIREVPVRSLDPKTGCPCISHDFTQYHQGSGYDIPFTSFPLHNL
jgi:hypothetical protein